MKHATIELGGKSSLTVFDDADLDNAVSGAIQGNFYSAGQICSNGTRVYLQSEIRKTFEEIQLKRAKAIRIGDPMDPSTQMGPLISKAQMDKLLGYFNLGLLEGTRILRGGFAARIPEFEAEFFVQSTIFTDVLDDMRIARQENSGPVMSILEFQSEVDVVRRANDCEFGLATGVFTSDIRRAHRGIDRIEAGTCCINTYNAMPVEMPFGGVKKSDIGRKNSKAAMDHYSQIESVFVEMGDVAAQY